MDARRDLSGSGLGESSVENSSTRAANPRATMRTATRTERDMIRRTTGTIQKSADDENSIGPLRRVEGN
jgi:hypothetical protein